MRVVVVIFLYMTLLSEVSARDLLDISQTSLYGSTERVYYTWCNLDTRDGIIESVPLDTCVVSGAEGSYTYWTKDGTTYTEKYYNNGCNDADLNKITTRKKGSCEDAKNIISSSKVAFYSHQTSDLWLAQSVTAKTCDSSLSEDAGLIYGVSYDDCIAVSDSNGNKLYYIFSRSTGGVKWTQYSDSSCSTEMVSSTTSFGSCAGCPPGESSCASTHIYRAFLMIDGSADGAALGIALTVLSTTAIAGAAASSAVSSGIGAGAGGGGGSGSPGALGAIMALLSSMQSLGMYSSLPFQTTPNLSAMTVNTAWTNLHISPPFSVPDCEGCQTSIVQNLSNPDLSDPQTQWIGNLFWWTIVFTLLLAIHLVVLCCWYGCVRCIKKDKEKPLPGFIALPKWEMMFMLISYQGLCLSTGAAAFTASADYTVAAVIVLIILFSFPCVMAGIIFFGSRKHVEYTSHHFCLRGISKWCSVFRSSCKRKPLTGLVSEEMAEASKQVWFSGKWSGNEEWLSKWDFVMLDLTTISRYWRVFELLWIFVRSLLITCLIGFVGAPYLQVSIILIFFAGTMAYRLIVGTHLQRYANTVGILSDGLNILALFMTMFTYSNGGTGLSNYNIAVIDALLTTVLASVIFMRLIPVLIIPLVGLIMLVKPLVDVILKSTKRSRNQTLNRMGSKLAQKHSSDNVGTAEGVDDKYCGESGVAQLEGGTGIVNRKIPTLTSMKALFVCGRGTDVVDESDTDNR